MPIGPRVDSTYPFGTTPFIVPNTGTQMTCTGTSSALCPDLLNLRDIGEADGWRGHVVRAFFHVLRVVTGL